MTGVGTLVGHFLRRDRWIVLAWTLGVSVLYWSQAVSVRGLYATQAEFDRAAASMSGNAALIAMAGPARALNTVGGQVTWQATAFGALCVGLMSMFLLGRHVRGEEESGRDELLRASAVDRHAPMTAALVITLLANAVVGAAVAASLVASDLAAADSLALGVGLTLTGWVFAGVALLAVQLASTTRAMYGVTGAVLGAAYALRAIGDVGAAGLSWVSPIGIYQRMYAFSGLRWWPALLLVAAAVAATVAAYAVFARRDFGAGIVAARPGPAHAGRWLAHPVGLAWRLQRGSVLGWALGLFLLGLAYGSMGSDVADLIGDSATSRDIIAPAGGDLVDAFYATAVLMLGLVAAGFAISSALRPRTEEAEGRVEALLATALPRRRWLAGQLTITLLGTLAVVLAGALGLAASFALVTGDGGTARTLAAVGLAHAAPVLVLAATTALLHALHPRLGSLGWLLLLFCVVVMMFGPLLRLPGWLQAGSPFHHLALAPAEPFRWLPLVALLGIAAVVAAVAQVAFGRRDLH